MHIKIDQKVATVENLTSCHFEFIRGFWRHLKGSGFVFQIRSIFAKNQQRWFRPGFRPLKIRNLQEVY